MCNELIAILKKVQSCAFYDITVPLCKLITLAKHLTDAKPTLHLCQMLACLLLNLNKYDYAFKIFDVARDICHDSKNLAQEMLTYEWMGRTL